jgi:hypothetical protein
MTLLEKFSRPGAPSNYQLPAKHKQILRPAYPDCA